MTGAFGSGFVPWLLVKIVIDDLSWTFKKGTASETRCIMERTLTSIVWSNAGIVQVISPFSTTTPWQRIKVSILPPKQRIMALENFYSILCGSLRSICSTKSTSLKVESFINSLIFGSKLSLSRTKRQSLRTWHFSNFLATADPTAPVAPVSRTLLPASLLLKSSDGMNFSVYSST